MKFVGGGKQGEEDELLVFLLSKWNNNSLGKTEEKRICAWRNDSSPGICLQRQQQVSTTY